MTAGVSIFELPWPRVLVFDVDGTLLDTLRPMRQALNEVLVSIGQVPWSEQAVREQLSLGLNGLLAAALREGGVTPGHAQERALQAELIQRYVALAPAHTRCYPAAGELLKQARAAGCRLAVCSNADGTVLHRLFDAFDWQHLFECVVHAGNALALKPSGLPLQQTLATLGVGPHEAWLVGDSALDARCAQAVGCTFVWFSGGYGGCPPQGLSARVDALDELVQRLARLA